MLHSGDNFNLESADDNISLNNKEPDTTLNNAKRSPLDNFIRWSSTGYTPFIASGLVGATALSLLEFLKTKDKRHFTKAILLGSLTGVSFIGLLRFINYVFPMVDDFKKSN